MKAFFLACFILALLPEGFSQTKTIRLYGYKQAVLSGRHAPYETNEKGEPIKKTAKPQTQFYFFIQYPSSLKVEPVELWLNRKCFTLTSQTEQTPIAINEGNINLVNGTKQNVFRLIPGPIKNKNKCLQNKSLALANELVVVVKMNGHYYTKALKALKILPAAPME